MNNFICFDLETGGLDFMKNPITEFAMIVYNRSEMKELFRFECFVKPYNDLTLDAEALKHTGITTEMLDSEGVDIEDLVLLLKDIFTQYTEGRRKMKPIMVGHNIANFDIGFLTYAFALFDLDLFDYIDSYCEDTLHLSRTKWCNDMAKFNLTACCEKAGIELIDAHRAMNDVEANKKLHEYLVKSLRNDVSISQDKEISNHRETFKF